MIKYYLKILKIRSYLSKQLKEAQQFHDKTIYFTENLWYFDLKEVAGWLRRKGYDWQYVNNYVEPYVKLWVNN